MSATIVLIETGMVQPIEPETSVMVDTPAGLIEARARIEGNRVIEVSVANVPSFLYAKDVAVDLRGIGSINVDVAFGGNFFALVPAKALGVAVHPENSVRLIELGAPELLISPGYSSLSSIRMIRSKTVSWSVRD
jgi:proline racemase